MGAIGFGFALLTFQIRQSFHPGKLGIGGPSFAEWSSYDAAWLLFGLGLLWAERRRPRKSLLWGGAAVLALGFVATVIGPPFLLNPLRDGSDVGSLPILNLLLFAFGLILLALGIARKSTALRRASLAVTLLAVAKVFLHDASNLTGLYRVVSFLGLGASLLGLAFVYQKFVLGRAEEGRERNAE